MTQEHGDLPFYDVVLVPPNPEAVKIKPELFVQEEHFTIPAPKSSDPLSEEPSVKRIK